MYSSPCFFFSILYHNIFWNSHKCTNVLSSGEGSAAVSTSFPTTGAEAAAQSVPSPDSWTIETGKEICSVTVPSTVMGAKGTREAGRRHQNSTMMEVEAMIEEVAVTGEEGISGRLNNFVEDRSGELEEGRISNDDCAISKAMKAGGMGTVLMWRWQEKRSRRPSPHHGCRCGQ
jgi:hypothetical protein